MSHEDQFRSLIREWWQGVPNAPAGSGAPRLTEQGVTAWRQSWARYVWEQTGVWSGEFYVSDRDATGYPAERRSSAGADYARADRMREAMRMATQDMPYDAAAPRGMRSPRARTWEDLYAMIA